MTTHARQQTAVAASSDGTSNHDPAFDGASTESRTARVRPFPAQHGHVPVAGPMDGERSSKAPFIIGALLLIAAAIAWYVWNRPATPAAGEGETKITAPLELAQVDISAVQPRVLTRLLPLSGSLSPVIQATVKSKVGGEVQELTVREGQDVREGDVIAKLDTRNLQAQYDREAAAVDKARADLELATLNREKNKSLLEQKFISQNTFEQTESAYAGSVASLKLAEAQARLAKINLEDANVRAPFAGTVARRLVQPGEKITPDASVVSLVDLRELLLEAAIPAAEIPSVKIGQSARFTVGGFGSRKFEGTVQRINPTTSEGSRAITIYVAVPNADRALKGGMFAQGELVLDKNAPVLSIPTAAVKYEAGVPIVYMLVNGKIERQQISVGEQVEGSDFIEVRGGLKEGERVIVADIGERKPGDAAFVKGEQSSQPVAKRVD